MQKKVKKVYIGSTKVRPITYLLHMPLENSLVDNSPYHRTATSTATPTYSTVWWVSAIKSYGTTLRVDVPMTNFTSSAYTQSIWYYATGSVSDFKCLWHNSVGSDRVDITFITDSSNGNKIGNYYVSDTFTSTTYNTGSWNMLTLVRNGDSQIIYHNGSQISSVTKTNQNYTYGQTSLMRIDWGQQRPWYLSDFLIDSVAWSAADVLEYYNSTKSKYWR